MVLCALAAPLLASCQTAPAIWPRAAVPALASDAAIDARARSIVAGMTLEQKVGQITQADIRSVTPDDVRRYYLGSILNGGGAWPGMNMHASVADWLKLSDDYYRASMSTDMAVKVPVIWGTDAVHGHNNVYGATLFPHNIGLGAAHDPALMARIGQATARAGPRDRHHLGVRADACGRAEPALGPDLRKLQLRSRAESAPMREAMVGGLQGQLGSPTSVLATAKHWLGDGGTFHGQNEGETRTSEANLYRTHAAGYYGALKANVQTVMVSYSSFTDTADRPRLGQDARQRLSDHRRAQGAARVRRAGGQRLERHRQVPGCTNWHCPQAINAGIDLVMVPDDWKKFIAATVADVRGGAHPDGRIDDAVTRIIAVKLRSGLFDASPATGPHPGAEVMSFPGGARARARGGAQVARAC